MQGRVPAGEEPPDPGDPAGGLRAQGTRPGAPAAAGWVRFAYILATFSYLASCGMLTWRVLVIVFGLVPVK